MRMLGEAVTLWRRAKGEGGTSLQLRLFAFFLLFISVLSSALFFLLTVGGVFDAGIQESFIRVENDMKHLSANLSADFGKLSLQGTEMAEQLSAGVDGFLKKNGIDGRGLQNRPQLLEELLSDQMTSLLSTLNNASCSGAFLVLDASVSPKQGGSKAGIFLKRTEPTSVSAIHSKVYYLRGPADTARSNGIELLGQWRMEFAREELGFFEKTMSVARENPRLPLSRLYFWSDRMLLHGHSESAMLLCVPLRRGDGSVLGVCGLEVSGMLFKQQYSPDNTVYPGIFTTLSPLGDAALETGRGLLAGNRYLTNPDDGQRLSLQPPKKPWEVFRAEDGQSYVGLYRPIKMYPDGSPYSGDTRVMAVIMPASDYTGLINGNRRFLYSSAAAMLVLSLVLALLISRRYIRPVVQALDKLQSDGRTEMVKTNILEIDDLIEYLSAVPEPAVPVGSGTDAVPPPDLSDYEEFVRNIGSLSTAELAVFNLYLQGFTAKEISEQLYLSMNTIKTHNRRIYTKLNVTSRKELMVYVRMMMADSRLGESHSV